MTALEYLNFFGEIYEVENRPKRIDKLMNAVGLEKKNKISVLILKECNKISLCESPSP